jgi:hypothetical protein
MPQTALSEWFTWPMVWLLAQVAAAAVSIRVFRLRIAPLAGELNDTRALADALGPLALALPLIAAAFRTEWAIAGAGSARANASVAGWLVVGGPIVCGLLALAAAAIASGHRGVTDPSAVNDRWRPARPATPGPWAIAAWTFAGAVLLLLSAAHDLTIWAGQCALVAGAAMLWMNTPDAAREPLAPADIAVANALTIMLGCGIVQALAVGMAPTSMLPIAGGLAIAHAAMLVMLAAVGCGPAITIRLGGWTATLGVLLGLGAISLRQMLPRAITVVQSVIDSQQRVERPPLRVAYGFGAFAMEAAILLALGAAALAVMGMRSRPASRVIGWMLMIVAAALAGWRLSAR